MALYNKDDVDADDDFFGSQEEDDLYRNDDDDDDNNKHDDNVANGAQRPTDSYPLLSGLAKHECQAREEELRTIGYLDSYDAHKEVLLQHGFEQGYRETFDTALRIGEILGQISAQATVLPSKDVHNDNLPLEADSQRPEHDITSNDKEGIPISSPQPEQQLHEAIHEVNNFLSAFDTNALEIENVPTEFKTLEHTLKDTLNINDVEKDCN